MGSKDDALKKCLQSFAHIEEWVHEFLLRIGKLGNLISSQYVNIGYWISNINVDQ